MVGMTAARKRTYTADHLRAGCAGEPTLVEQVRRVPRVVIVSCDRILATVNDPIIYATNFYLKAAASGTGSTTIITTPQPITTTAP